MILVSIIYLTMVRATIAIAYFSVHANCETISFKKN